MFGRGFWFVSSSTPTSADAGKGGSTGFLCYGVDMWFTGFFFFKISLLCLAFGSDKLLEFVSAKTTAGLLLRGQVFFRWLFFHG